MKTSQRSVAAVCLASTLTFLAGTAHAASLTSAPFGRTRDGRAVTRYTMTSAGGVRVQFISYGGIITDVVTPDRQGRLAPIVLGFSTLPEYETKSGDGGLYLGAIIGRYANYIAGGHFRLNGHRYTLAKNYPPNTLHGGTTGFDRRLWQVQPISTSGPRVSARLTYTSPDGEEGFPGTLKIRVAYTLSDDGAFTIHYSAVTDKDTVVALTSHLSFNLAGAGSLGSVLTQVLQIDADHYLPTDSTQLPTGQAAPVQGTPFDFRRPTAIGTHIHDKNAQLAIQGGYDQEWVLNKHGDLSNPQLAVRVYDPKSGRTLDCLTTEPGVLSYTGGDFNGTISGIGGRYRQFAAFTLETQHFPDSPNHPQFPTTELKPGQTYSSTTIFRFGVQK